ncbi:hypothetical protein [Prochlorococcus marinus]|uniref:hypothetical protein n=1 Tax=Prochlorococcus marinus TaxID=1219 RepID=UPI0022B4F047|nr:hypothetical protein [Prochlorococcus marinus]
MNTISNILKWLRNQMPYLLLIAIYFFFVNIEAKKEKNKNLKSYEKKILHNNTSDSDDKNIRIEIPVVPFNE